MAVNSTITANLALQLSSQIGGLGTPLATRFVPPLAYNSSVNAVFSGYLSVTAGANEPQTIFTIGGAPYAIFSFFRNASTSSIIELFLTFPNSLTSPTNILLNPGGWQMYAQPNAQGQTTVISTSGVSLAQAGLFETSQAAQLEYWYGI